jgi:hydroxyethylthiazole kinase-like uncharacterized protein yjeF
MRLPTQLSRQKNNVYKNTFGHVLVIAGSRRMLGAGALTSLSAMRSGAGLTTWVIPKSLNLSAQKKASNTVMTWPLNETKEGFLSFSASKNILLNIKKYNSIAIGPGLSQNPSTAKFINKIISDSNLPIVIDADALNCIANNLTVLKKSNSPKILTPHPGEMAKLTGLSIKEIESKRKTVAEKFALQNKCILVLKGHQTVVTNGNNTYINKTGNAGMATAGSGDVLTGIITAFLAQGVDAFVSAKYGAFVHGKAGNLAAKSKTKISMIASDIIDYIPQAIK